MVLEDTCKSRMTISLAWIRSDRTRVTHVGKGFACVCFKLELAFDEPGYVSRYSPCGHGEGRTLGLSGRSGRLSGAMPHCRDASEKPYLAGSMLVGMVVLVGDGMG